MAPYSDPKETDQSDSVSIETGQHGQGITDSVEVSMDVDEEAGTLLAQGKRHLLVGNGNLAAEQLQKVCSLLSEKYGDGADECGDALYYYGCALLEVARMENTVLGNALEGTPLEDTEVDDSITEDPDQMTGEEREEVEEQVAKALVENAETIKEKVKELKENPEKLDEKTKEMIENAEKIDAEMGAAKDEDEESEEDEEEEVNTEQEESKSEQSGSGEQVEESETTEKLDVETTETALNVSQEQEASSNVDQPIAAANEPAGVGETVDPCVSGPSTSRQPVESEEDTEDASDLQLAWESLELARTIFGKREGKEARLRLAQIHMKLGELGLEQDSLEQAIGDFMQCVKIREELLEKDSRLAAEARYNLGLAHGMAKQADESLKNFSLAISALELRIENLTKKLESCSESEKESIESEIKELKEVIPEVKLKIEDSQEVMEEENITERTDTDIDNVNSCKPAVMKPRPITDISHLVRKKRKPEGEDSGEESKKFKAECDGPEGDVQVTNGTNGDTEPVLPTTKDTTEVKPEDEVPVVKNMEAIAEEEPMQTTA